MIQSMQNPPGDSQPSARTLAKFWPNSRHEPSASPSTPAWPFTIPATCSTPRVFARNPGRCCCKFPARNCSKFPNLPSAAGPPASTISSSPKPPPNSATARPASSPRSSPTWWRREIPAASCNCDLPSPKQTTASPWSTPSSCWTLPFVDCRWIRCASDTLGNKASSRIQCIGPYQLPNAKGVVDSPLLQTPMQGCFSPRGLPDGVHPVLTDRVLTNAANVHY